MSSRFKTSAFLWVVALLAPMLTSCAAKKLPPLDRAGFIEETAIKLPNDAEILDSLAERDQYGTHYNVLLKMPKSAEGVLPGPGIEEDPKMRTSASEQLRQVNMNWLSKVGVKLRDPKAPTREYKLKTKSKGDGNATVYGDGETIYVLCSFGIQS